MYVSDGYADRIANDGSTSYFAQACVVPLNMEGCICHFTEWQIHLLISKGTMH